MLGRVLLALGLLFLLPVPALAQSFETAFADLSSDSRPAEASPLEGSWALRLGGAIIFRFDLERVGGEWQGAWSRPRSFASDGNRFGSLTGPSVQLDADASRTIGEWVELTFEDNRPGAVPDIFRFRALGPDSAELIYAETGLAPYTLERVSAGAVLGPWEPGRVYRRDAPPGEELFRLPPNETPRQTAPATQEQPAFEGR